MADPVYRSSLRRVFCELAGVLGATFAIYLPDSGYGCSGVEDLIGEGRSIEEMLQWLRNEIGDPAPSIEAIRSDPWDGNGYFIDRFEDEASSLERQLRG